MISIRLIIAIFTITFLLFFLYSCTYHKQNIKSKLALFVGLFLWYVMV